MREFLIVLQREGALHCNHIGAPTPTAAVTLAKLQAKNDSGHDDWTTQLIVEGSITTWSEGEPS